MSVGPEREACIRKGHGSTRDVRSYKADVSTSRGRARAEIGTLPRISGCSSAPGALPGAYSCGVFSPWWL
ncbi:hypothetical protein ACH4SP_40915 [Streptomyces sp. NPDC021093]|uniref:hypothetical protein n=1 Tax=Streptomyces sp. NPDC021093 TaxID=3365112 RepID=UPI0037AEAFF5